MLAALLLMLVSFGSPTLEPLAQGKRAPRPATYHVTIDATKFEPSALNVREGDRIVWTNKDLFPHTATSKAGGFDSGRIEPGQSWSTVVRKKGSFDVICTFHPAMAGAVRVR